MSDSTITYRFVDLAEAQPDQRCLIWLDDAGEQADARTRIELWRRAAGVAAALRERGLRGERVLLIYPPGLDFADAYYGCLFAGAIPVPVPLIDRRRVIAKAEAFAADCDAGALMAPAALLDALMPAFETRPDTRPILARLVTIASDLAADAGGPLEPGDARPEDLAVLQYTSGSTRDPRGVMVRHRDVVHDLDAFVPLVLPADAPQLWLSWMPHFHDGGLFTGFTIPLLNPYPALLMSPATIVTRPQVWLEAISRYGAPVSGGPNFAYDLCTRRIPDDALAGLDLSGWRTAYNGAEPIRAQTLADFTRRFAPCGFRREAFMPAMGMAECVAVSHVTQGPTDGRELDVDREALLAGKVERSPPGPQARRLVGNGRTIPGVRCLIVDPERREAVPEGEVGELWLAGPTIAQGYWGRPELSEAVFRATLADGGGPYLRSGDLCFELDGELFVTGRLKEVIIVRGENHAPQDIEATSSGTHPALSNVAVAAAIPASEDEHEGLCIVQGVSSQADPEALDMDAILDAIEEAVTTHHGVRPTHVAIVASRDIAKTTSGKLRRLETYTRLREGNLPVLAQRHNPSQAHVGAAEVRTRLEALLRERHALGPEAARASFFAAGLDSLAVIELVAALEDTLDLRLPPGAAWLAEDLDSLLELALERGVRARARQSDPLAEAEQRADLELPSSSSQQAIWTWLREHRNSPAYNVGFAAEVHAKTEPERLHRAWTAVVARHPQLRARFFEREGELVRIIEPPGPTPFELTRIGPIDDEELHDRVQAFSREPFVQDRGEVARAGMLVAEGRAPVLMIVVSHLVVDLPSVEIIIRDLIHAHRGDGAALSPAGGSFSELVNAERALETGARGLALRRFWAAELDGMGSLRDLPLDHPGEAGAAHARARISVRPDPVAIQKLRATAKAAGATLHVALATLFGELLARLTRQRDFGVMLAINRRSGGRRSDVVGDFVNLVPWRCQLDAEAGYAANVDQVNRRLRAAFAHADLPYAEIVRSVAAPRGLGHGLLSPVGFHLQRAGHGVDLGLNFAALGAGECIDPEGLKLRPIHANPSWAQAPLYLELIETERDGAVVGTIEYDAVLFEADTAARIARSFEHLCSVAAVDPERPLIELETAPLAERRRVQLAFNETATPFPEDEDIRGGFEAQVAKTPDAPAVADSLRRWDFATLDQIANGVAWALIDAGVRPDATVGVALPRGVGWAAAMLGVWKAGGVYVPLSLDDPDTLLDARLREVEARVVIGAPPDAPRWRDRGVTPLTPGDWTTLRRGDRPPIERGPSDRAYICFTSGSTGSGDGVQIEHRSIRNVLANDPAVFCFSAATRFGHVIHFAFEPSINMLLGPLGVGGQVFIAEAPELASGQAMLRWFRERRITHASVITALLAALPEPRDLDTLKFVAVGGEACTAALVRRWQPGRRLLNAYGPTETTCLATYEVCQDDGQTPTIGRAYPNDRVYVLDDRREPVGIGEIGEIYIGGVGVARGYVARPEKTAARFTADPLGLTPDARVYQTGDLGRFRADGRIEYHGRRDRQVKVSGVRLQPEAVEATLGACPEVRACAVRHQGGRLTAWIVLTPDSVLDAVQRYCRVRLPRAAVPTTWVTVDALPRTPTGKVDRAALPSPAQREGDAKRSDDPVQARLMQLFARVLPGPPPSAEADFFECGGDSLGLLQLLDRIEAEWGRVFTHAQFLEDPTPAGVARGLADAPAGGSLPVLVPLRSIGDRPPLFCVVAGYGDLVSFRTLAAKLSPEQPFFACQPPHLDADEGLDALIQRYASAITEAAPSGPCRLAGYSAGGLVALEVARRLRRDGRDVDFLGMLDTPGEMLARDALVIDGSRQVLGRALGQLMATRSRVGRVAHFAARDRGFRAQIERLRGYTPEPYLGPVTLFVPTWSHQRFRVGRRTWERVVKGGLEICRVPGDHESFIRMPHVAALARELGDRLAG